MAGSGVSAGHETRVNYYWEDNGFANSPNDSQAKTFGVDVTVNTFEGSNEISKLFMPGSRVAVDQLATIFDGRFTVEFTLTNPWWVRAFLGSPNTTDQGDGSHQHAYHGEGMESMRVVEGHEQSGKERVVKGMVPQSFTIDLNVEEVVTCTIEGLYADEELNDPDTLTAQTQPSRDPFTYAEGSVKVGGATEAYVQSASVSYTSNAELIRELGTRTAIDYNERPMEPSVDLQKIFDGDHESLESMYGSSGATSPEDRVDNKVAVEAIVDNGAAAGSGINQTTFELTGTLSESYGEQGVGNPREDLQEAVTRAGLDMNVTAVNETATAP